MTKYEFKRNEFIWAEEFYEIIQKNAITGLVRQEYRRIMGRSYRIY